MPRGIGKSRVTENVPITIPDIQPTAASVLLRFELHTADIRLDGTVARQSSDRSRGGQLLWPRCPSALPRVIHHGVPIRHEHAWGWVGSMANVSHPSSELTSPHNTSPSRTALTAPSTAPSEPGASPPPPLAGESRGSSRQPTLLLQGTNTHRSVADEARSKNVSFLGGCESITFFFVFSPLWTQATMRKGLSDSLGSKKASSVVLSVLRDRTAAWLDVKNIRHTHTRKGG